MAKKSADPTSNAGADSPVNETTPLLNAPESGPEARVIGNGDTSPSTVNGHKPNANNDTIGAHTNDDEAEPEKPMPVLQVLLLCFVSLSEPIAYFSIFPFMPEMAQRVGNLDESDVGFWTGVIESLFSLVQMVLMIFYGRAADRLGRKPVLVFSLAGVSVFTALFGMSRTLWQMVLTRCMAGFFGGTVVTIRTMLSENCTKKSQARAFSWYMFARNMGIFLGPLIGGPLANPVEQFPATFKHSAFFAKYPYALASYIAGSFCIIATLAALFGIKETLKRGDGKSGSEALKPMSTWEVLRAPGVGIVLYIYGHTMLLSLAYTAVSPVFLYTDISKGGWSFSDQWIAIFLAIAGASQALWMLIAFPPLQKRYGTGNVLRGCAAMFPLMMALFPFENELLRHGFDTAFWATFPPGIVLGSGVAMAFACVQLCINDIAPNNTVLGTINALNLTVNSGVRAFAPIAFTSLYAAGVKLQWADGHLVWFVLVFLGLSLSLAVYFLPARAEGRYDKDDGNDS